MARPSPPPMNRTAASQIAMCAVDVTLDGGAIPRAVEIAADRWHNGKGTGADWATLWAWAITRDECANIKGI